MAILLLPAEELGWEPLPGSPGKHQAFPRQWEGRVEMLCGGEIGKMWTSLLAQAERVEGWSAAGSWHCFHRQQGKVWSVEREYFNFQGHCGAHIAARSQ